MEVNETKVTHAIGAKELRPARNEEIQAAGAIPGFAGPLGVNALTVVDDLIPQVSNLVMGANREGAHLRNVNYGRDFTADVVADVAAAREGDLCVVCGKPLRASRGVEVGNIFKLGTTYSDAFEAYYRDQDGQTKPIYMGSYGIGIGRLLSCLAEHYHDAAGLKLPITVAPYHIHLLALRAKDVSVASAAEDLYLGLQSAGLEVLFDDRPDVAAGVKLADADLIGIPLRLVVSERTLKSESVEFRLRGNTEAERVSIGASIAKSREIIDQLVAEAKTQVAPVVYSD